MSISQFNYFDYALLVITFISIIWGLKRGVIREVISLLTWVAAFYAAMTFSPLFSTSVGKFIKDPTVASIVSGTAIFFAVLIIGCLLNFIISTLFNFTGMGISNRLFGGVFGFGRGVVISLLIIIGLSHTQLYQAEWFKQARLTTDLQPLVTWIQQQFNISIPAATATTSKTSETVTTLPEVVDAN